MDIKTLYIVIIVSFLFVGVLFLVKSRNKRKANFQMALFLFAMAISILQTLFKELHFGYYFFGIPVSYTIGVSLFFYTQYSIGKNKKDLSGFYWLHYLPAIVFFIIFILIEFGISETDRASLANNMHSYLMDKSIYSYAFIGMMFHFFGYAIYSLSKLFKYEKLQENYTTKEVGVNLKWLKYLLVSLLVIGISTVVSFLLKAPRIVLVIQPVLCFVVIIFIIFNAVVQPQVFEELAFDAIEQSLEDRGDEDENLIQVKQQIETYLMASKSFLQKDYTVKQLADEIAIASYKVSKAINRTLNTNFSRLINFYRIEEAKSILVENKDLTIDAIADMVGFNSKVSFIDSFKKTEKITPHAFRVKKLKVKV